MMHCVGSWKGCSHVMHGKTLLVKEAPLERTAQQHLAFLLYFSLHSLSLPCNTPSPTPLTTLCVFLRGFPSPLSHFILCCIIFNSLFISLAVSLVHLTFYNDSHAHPEFCNLGILMSFRVKLKSLRVMNHMIPSSPLTNDWVSPAAGSHTSRHLGVWVSSIWATWPYHLSLPLVNIISTLSRPAFDPSLSPLS